MAGLNKILTTNRFLTFGSEWQGAERGLRGGRETIDPENRGDMQREIERLKKEINLLKIKEVEKQQEEFGEK